VFNRLGDLSLPSGVTPSVSPLSAPSGLIYRYVLQSPDRSPMELKTFEAWTVEPQYKSVPGVADDSGFGGGTMQYQVLLDPAKIAAVGLSVQQVEARWRQQRQRRRRLLFAGRPVLLRARPGPHGNAGGHRQRGGGGA
jgi:Cu/Ag efflux pump CusA